jgi:hypothetical protein
MQPVIMRPGVAAAIAEEARQRRDRTRQQHTAENVARGRRAIVAPTAA